MRTRDEHKRQAIFHKALKMVVEKGFDGLSMQKLAKAAGVSPATIYIHFKDRSDLILQLWQAEMEKMIDATLKDFDPLMPFDKGLRIQWINRVNFCLENPSSMHFMEQIKFSPFYHVAMKNMNSKFVETMGTFVHNAIKRKELVKLPLEVYWSVAFAPMYQLVRFHTSGRGLGGTTKKFILDEKAINLSLELVLKALTPTATTKK